MKRMMGLAVAVIMALPADGLADQDRTIAVTGYGEISTEPDIAKVQLGIFVFDKDLLAAKRETDRKITAIVALLAKMDIAAGDITTTQLYVNPKYRDSDQSVEFIGYEITRSINVTLRKINQLNELLEQSIQAGANRIDRIDLTTSKEKELQDQVLTLAITNAKEVAGRIAAGFGAKLGKVMSVSVDSGSGEVRFNMLSAPIFSEAKYQPGTIAVSAEIEVIFALTD